MVGWKTLTDVVRNPVAVVRRFRPPSPLAGRLATQSLLFALGEGTFMTGSAMFFASSSD